MSNLTVHQPHSDIAPLLTMLAGLLASARFTLTDEIKCQNQIERLLADSNVPYNREYRLDDAGVIDFFLPRSGIGLEVKVHSQVSRRSIYRQVERYCGHEEIGALLLATGRCMSLPRDICGKPVRVHSLSLGIFS